MQADTAGRPLPAEHESLDLLTGAWRIFQLRRGHRFSTDDMAVAWAATQARPQARRLLDIGSGTGSVGLLTLGRMDPAATTVLVEVQQVSHELEKKTIAWNDLSHRVTLRHGDLRDAAVVPDEQVHDLVTGSPPYIPPDKGVISPVPQRAAARHELHGDVFDYCRAAARALHPDGAFCMSHSAVDPRPYAAIAEAGLVLLGRQDVVFRRGQPPTIAVFTCARRGERTDPEPLVIRDERGAWTAQYQQIRRFFEADSGG